MKRTRIAAIALVGLASAGCSSTSGSSATTSVTIITTTTTAPVVTTTTQSVAVLGTHVVSIITASNAAIQSDKAEPGTTGFPAISAAFSTAAQQLQALSYPAAAQADAKTLIAILEKLSVDVTQAETDPVGTVI